MNKKLLVTISIGVALALSGCNMPKTAEHEESPRPEHTHYFQSGRYYFDADMQGQVVTDDGNVWGYTQDIISDKPSYHYEPVYAVFDDMGTPNNIYDDEIVGLVLDRETAIYDAIEEELSEDFSIDREGNTMRICIKK